MKTPTPARVHQLLCITLACLLIISFVTFLVLSFNSSPIKAQNLFSTFTILMLILYTWVDRYLD